MREDWQPKILGIMQSSVDKTLQISFVDNLIVVTSQSGAIHREFTNKEFRNLTVHQILDRAGVEIDAKAGK